MGVWFNFGIPCSSKNCFIDTAVWGFALSCKRNQLPLLKLGSYSMNSLNQTRQYFHIIFWFPDCQRMWPASLGFLAFEIEIFCVWKLGKQHSMHCLFVWGSFWKNQVSSITHYSWVQHGMIINRLNKLLTSLQSESLLFTGQAVWNKHSTDLPLRFCNFFFFFANFEFLFHHLKSHSTISLNQFPNCFDHFKCLNDCYPLRTSLRFWRLSRNIAHDSKTRVQESIVTISLFYSWKVSVAVLLVLKQNLMFALCSITRDCHNNLHGTKS
jgi:hypothetical protein